MAAVAEARKGIERPSPTRRTHLGRKINRLYTGPDDEGTINVASKKATKAKPSGFIKLKRAAPKQTKPGNWRDGSVADGALCYAMLCYALLCHVMMDDCLLTDANSLTRCYCY